MLLVATPPLLARQNPFLIVILCLTTIATKRVKMPKQANNLSIEELLQWASEYFNEKNIFFGHGTDNAWDEAVALARFAFNLPLDVTTEVLPTIPNTKEANRFIELVNKRVSLKKPAPYLTNQAYFMGLEFYVDERVIVPRSPIFELIAEKFSPWLQSECKTILDLCTGSGCIGIACKYAFANSTVDLVDISDDALAVAKINCEKHQQDNGLIKSDLFSNVNRRYDLIVSNPPYVAEEEYKELPSEYKHEPVISLVTEDNGIKIPVEILKQAAAYLNDNGILVMEVGNSQKQLTKVLPNLDCVWLEFDNGGSGVLVITAEQLKKHVW